MNVVFYLHDEKDPEALVRKLTEIGKHYHFISAAEVYDILHAKKRIRNACHITIDDGWRSTYDVIFPVLKKLGIPASIFVSPWMCERQRNFWYVNLPDRDGRFIRNELIHRGFFKPGIDRFPVDLLLKEIPIDDVYSILDEETATSQRGEIPCGIVTIAELREMDASGLVEVGAHTMSHPILSREKASRAETEMKDSIEKLSEILGHPVTSFAYPNGLYGCDFGEREMAVAQSCGIKLAYSVDPGALSATSHPLRIPRVGSLARLRLGLMGLRLPSLHNQKNIRKKIRAYKHENPACN